MNEKKDRDADGNGHVSTSKSQVSLTSNEFLDEVGVVGVALRTHHDLYPSIYGSSNV